MLNTVFCSFKCFAKSTTVFNPGKSIIILLPFKERANWASRVHEKPELSVGKFLPQILFNKVVFPTPTEPN